MWLSHSSETSRMPLKLILNNLKILRLSCWKKVIIVSVENWKKIRKSCKLSFINKWCVFNVCAFDSKGSVTRWIVEHQPITDAYLNQSCGCLSVRILLEFIKKVDLDIKTNFSYILVSFIIFSLNLPLLRNYQRHTCFTDRSQRQFFSQYSCESERSIIIRTGSRGRYHF